MNGMNREVAILRQMFLLELAKANPLHILRNFLEVLNFPIAILNSTRQVLFFNESFKSRFGWNSVEEIIGGLPGEAMNCLHANEPDSKPCGQNDQCQFCGILKSFTLAKDTGETVTSDTKSLLLINNELQAYDFHVTITPFELNNKHYYLLLLVDVSETKHKRRMERIFFHDILNKISALHGLYQLMQKENCIAANTNNYFQLMGSLIQDLSDEINFQRQLAAAEKGELIVKFEQTDIAELINKVIQQIKNLNNTADIEFIHLDNMSQHFIFTDPVLINRSITNLLKNALEASKSGDEIRITTSESETYYIISVQNPSYIPKENQSQIFHRSFSTKGESRGLGTYSVKMLIERYLNGKVYFTSTPEKGTTFYIELPKINYTISNA